MKRTRRSKRLRRNDRGSALLVSLMVIVGLSLLGLGFVAISETESAIAKNEQNALQTQAVAEAGAMLVVEWFQNPTWAIANAAMPSNDGTVNANLAATKITRTIPNYSGVYRPNSQQMLLDKPYRPSPQDRLYGSEDFADLTINRTTDSTTIDNFNNVLLGPNASDKTGGEVTEIKIYAPPMVNANLVNGFYVGGERYGLATIKVTATLFRDPNGSKTAASNIIASHAVRLVVGEIPLPIPGGPIQSNTAISFNGDFIVHWGNETSTGSLKNKRDTSVVPWANAFEHLHFEHGYEPGSTISSITVTQGGTGYTAAQNNTAITIAAPCCGGTTATATMQVSGGSVTGVTITNRGTKYANAPGAAPQNWGPVVTFPAPAGGGTTATGFATIGAEAWPITGAQFEDAPYLQEVVDKTFGDPWFGSRAVGTSNGPGCAGIPPTFSSPNNAQCTYYSYSANETADESHFFEWQSVNVYPWQKVVLFPKINYDFWKRVTRQSRGLKGMYYFGYDGAGGFKLHGSGASQGMCAWVNTQSNNLGPGVYFFDTANGLNPQSGGPGTLTPAESWNSACMGSGMLMVGFIYMNASSYGTSGVGSKETNVPEAAFPGEPFRDIGYPHWDTASNAWDTSCGGQICRVGVGDGTFSYQDLNGNNQFDVITMPAPAWSSYDPGATAHAAGAQYVPKTWKSDAQAIADYGSKCFAPGSGGACATCAGGTTECSEPHEPYLNYIYSNARANAMTVGWEASGTQTRYPKKTGVTCTASSSQADCTSNAFDLDGAIVTDMSTILDGVGYNEGDYSSTGNADYFGSLLIQGTVSGSGTPDIWFDEKLLKGTWAPPGMPRVMIFSVQTDEMSQQ